MNENFVPFRNVLPQFHAWLTKSPNTDTFFFARFSFPQPLLCEILCGPHLPSCVDPIYLLVWTQTPEKHPHTHDTKYRHYNHPETDFLTDTKNNQTHKMSFNSLFEAATKSPFKGPLTVAECATAASAGGASGDSCEFGSNKFFLLCGLGGIISCGKCVADVCDHSLSVKWMRAFEKNISVEMWGFATEEMTYSRAGRGTFGQIIFLYSNEFSNNFWNCYQN